LNEAFPAPQIGHIYYYMKIPAELAGHGGFVGDYAEKYRQGVEVAISRSLSGFPPCVPPARPPLRHPLFIGFLAD